MMTIDYTTYIRPGDATEPWYGVSVDLAAVRDPDSTFEIGITIEGERRWMSYDQADALSAALSRALADARREDR